MIVALLKLPRLQTNYYDIERIRPLEIIGYYNMKIFYENITLSILKTNF